MPGRLSPLGRVALLAGALALSGAVLGGSAGPAAAPDHAATLAAALGGGAPQQSNLWVDANGGRCARTDAASEYADAGACASIDAAWDKCRPGDVIGIRAGTYGPQTINGDRPAPGCAVVGENGTTIGDLATDGAFFALGNVTVDVGDAKRAGWKATASNVTLSNVRLRGAFVAVDINGANDVRWLGGELGVAGQTGGKRVCGADSEPVQIGDADRVTFDRISFHPQDADLTPSSCSANGFHLEMIRIDGGVSAFRLTNSTFDNGDHSGTASVFITEPGGYDDPRDLVFQNNFFGTNDAVGAFNVHSNVTTCANFTFAYNTFRGYPGAFQCTTVENVRWIGNLGTRPPSSTCFGTFVANVWQDTGRDNCGSDRWVSGARGATDRLGLGGPDGFRLQPGSPAINAGEAGGYCVESLGGRDHDRQGRPRGRRCDAGADEYNAPGPGPVGASLTGTKWASTSAGVRVLTVTLKVDEPVAARVALQRRGRTLATRSYRALLPGSRGLRITVPRGVAAGVGRIRVDLEDNAGNQQAVQRAARVP